MIPKSLAWLQSVWPQPTICKYRSVEQIADKRGFVHWKRGLFNSNTGPSHTNKKYILKQPDTEELCRRCGKESVTIQHITTTCQQLAPTKYVKRHDGLAKIIHQKLPEAAKLIDDKSPYYKYTPANVLENENF
jgi:ribosomal protein L37E